MTSQALNQFHPCHPCLLPEGGISLLEVKINYISSTLYYNSVNFIFERKFAFYSILGPDVIGKENFDDYCIFANKMLLDRNHITSIENMVDDYGWYPIKFYIYKMNPSTVNESSKMVIILKHIFFPFFAS